MTVQLAPSPVFQALGTNGAPLAFGLLYTYQAGTTTPQATYVDSTQTTQNTNPVVLNAYGQANVWLATNQTYKLTLTDSSNNQLYSVDQIAGGIVLTQAVLAQILNPQTGNEQITGIVPTNYSYLPGDVRRYGWSVTNTAAQNSAALTSAITAFNNQGGTVSIPAGTYALSAGTSVPAGVTINGAGRNATILTYTGNSDVLFTLGGLASPAYYGCGLTNLRVNLTGLSGTVALLQQTVGALVANCYFEGETITSGRSTRGVAIDGGGSNLSGFFNSIREVECNHFHNGFFVFSSGITQPTQQYFIGCAATGDFSLGDTTSVGFTFGTGADVSPCAQDTVLVGCDTENCSIGFSHTATAGPITHIDSRGEGNTTDISFALGAIGSTIVGGLITTISDSSGDFRHQYFGLRNGSNVVNNRAGPTLFGANLATDSPIIVRMAASPTGAPIQVQLSNTTPLFQVSAKGAIGLWGATPPTTQLTGFGTPTGASVVANFPGASATLVQCSNTIAELITILTQYGIIGT